MRNELTEEQITSLMQAIPRAEAEHWAAREINKLRAENEKLRADRRERIATAALPGLLSKWGGTPQQAADFAIQYADALIAKLDKEEGKP